MGTYAVQDLFPVALACHFLNGSGRIRWAGPSSCRARMMTQPATAPSRCLNRLLTPPRCLNRLLMHDATDGQDLVPAGGSAASPRCSNRLWAPWVRRARRAWASPAPGLVGWPADGVGTVGLLATNLYQGSQRELRRTSKSPFPKGPENQQKVFIFL